MPKYKYYYDQETLSYRRIEVNTGVRFRKAFVFLTVSALFGLIMLLVLLSSTLIETPKEIAQAREIDNYQLQYEQLNRKMQQIESVLDNLQDRDNQIYRVIFEANPISEDVRKAGFGGVNRYSDLEGFENSELVISTTKRMEILSKQVVVQSKSLDEIQRMALDKEVLLSAIPSIQPINNEDLRRMASGYGWRTDPFTKTRRKHKGMDFSAPTGTPVYSTSDGKVIRVDGRAPGYGNHIRIDHGFGYVTLYAHLSKYNVRPGQEVKRGDVIGFVGNTGRSVAPHLHLSLIHI